MKVWNYIWLSLTMMLILTFAGFETPFTNILFYLGLTFGSDFTLTGLDFAGSGLLSYFRTAGTGFLSIIGGIGVGIGLFVTGRSDIAIKAGFATAVLVMFMPVVVYPILYSLQNFAGWVTALLTVIFIPYAVGFVISIVEFVSGGTSD